MGRPPIGKVAMTAAERMRRHRAKFRHEKPVTKPLRITKRQATEIVAMVDELTLARKAMEQLDSERDEADETMASYLRLARDRRVQFSATLYDLLATYAAAVKRAQRRTPRKRRTRGHR